VEPCVLLEISEAALERVAESQADIWRAIADFTYANMRSVLRMAADAISLPPRQHIVARLLAAAAVGDSAEIPVVRISQDLLGEMIGVTRKTVNHHLSKLERDGLLKLGYGRIELLDLERLRAVANG
jgi:CRP-like cAMP-binding protein